MRNDLRGLSKDAKISLLIKQREELYKLKDECKDFRTKSKLDYKIRSLNAYLHILRLKGNKLKKFLKQKKEYSERNVIINKRARMKHNGGT